MFSLNQPRIPGQTTGARPVINTANVAETATVENDLADALILRPFADQLSDQARSPDFVFAIQLARNSIQRDAATSVRPASSSIT